jgi:hypothetical protein
LKITEIIKAHQNGTLTGHFVVCENEVYYHGWESVDGKPVNEKLYHTGDADYIVDFGEPVQELFQQLLSFLNIESDRA